MLHPILIKEDCRPSTISLSNTEHLRVGQNSYGCIMASYVGEKYEISDSNNVSAGDRHETLHEQHVL